MDAAAGAQVGGSGSSRDGASRGQAVRTLSPIPLAIHANLLFAIMLRVLSVHNLDPSGDQWPLFRTCTPPRPAGPQIGFYRDT